MGTMLGIIYSAGFASNTIALSSAVGTDSQIMRKNTPITNITYLTTGATGAGVIGLPAGVTGAYNPATHTFTISGTPTVAGIFNYTVNCTGGSGTGFKTGEISVDVAINTIALTSAPGTNDQEVNEGAPIVNITYATTGATGATFAGLPAGVVGAWLANVITISGTPTASGQHPYKITLTGGSPLDVVEESGAITMIAAPNTIALTSAPGTDAQEMLLDATPITNITYGTTGATGANFAGLPAGVVGAWLANVVTISGTPTAVGLFKYTVTLTGGSALDVVTIDGNISVGDTITLTSAPGTDNQAVIMPAAMAILTYDTTGATGANFIGLPPGVFAAWIAGTITISDPPTMAGQYPFRIETTGGYRSAIANGVIVVT
jgi:hypothetical protein